VGKGGKSARGGRGQSPLKRPSFELVGQGRAAREIGNMPERHDVLKIQKKNGAIVLLFNVGDGEGWGGGSVSLGVIAETLFPV